MRDNNVNKSKCFSVQPEFQLFGIPTQMPLCCLAVVKKFVVVGGGWVVVVVVGV